MIRCNQGLKSWLVVLTPTRTIWTYLALGWGPNSITDVNDGAPRLPSSETPARFSGASSVQEEEADGTTMALGPGKNSVW